MIIYGTALLSTCLLLGLTLGKFLGSLAGIEADIGGVGISMLLLIASCAFLQQKGYMKPPTEAGIAFWGSIYIPIVVAMAASQNVLAAVNGGIVAILAGASTVAASFAIVGIFIRIGNPDSNSEE
ncbi:MAG: malonate transporter subunit MadL [Gemmataceae bacterium]